MAKNIKILGHVKIPFDKIIDLINDKDQQDKAVLVIKQALVDHSFVADPEINLASCMIKLARLSNG